MTKVRVYTRPFFGHIGTLSRCGRYIVLVEQNVILFTTSCKFTELEAK